MTAIELAETERTVIVHGCKCGKGYWYTCEGLWLHRVLFGHTPTWDGVWRGE